MDDAGWRAYQPGSGPHPEGETVKLVVAQMQALNAEAYSFCQPVPYPASPLKCDLGVGDPLDWAGEVKMARALGDNDKLDATAVKDLLSPYADDRSELTDAAKLCNSKFACRMAVLVCGFDAGAHARPLEPVLDALDALLRIQGLVGDRIEAPFDNLVHRVHRHGLVNAWEVPRNSSPS